MATLIPTIQASLRYRGGTSHWAYQFHRLAGLGTLLFLTIHILDTSTVFFVPSLYEHAIELYRNPLFMLGEIALVAAVIYHGLNGLKIIVFDLRPQLWTIEREQAWSWIVYAGSFVLWLPAAFLMGRALYANSICNCPLISPPASDNTIDAVTFVILAVLAVATLAVIGLVWGAIGRRSGGATPRTIETWMWQFMRWSGVLLIPLAFGHVLIKDVLDGVHHIDLDYVALYWSFIGWRVYDGALLGFAFAHGMNGLKQVAEDYVHRPGAISVIRWLILLGWVVITAIGATALVGGVRLDV